MLPKGVLSQTMSSRISELLPGLQGEAKLKLEESEGGKDLTDLYRFSNIKGNPSHKLH